MGETPNTLPAFFDDDPLEQRVALVLDEDPASSSAIADILSTDGYETFVGTHYADLEKVGDENVSRVSLLVLSTSLPTPDSPVSSTVDEPLTLIRRTSS